LSLSDIRAKNYQTSEDQLEVERARAAEIG
jgi:hypothetical protein